MRRWARLAEGSLLAFSLDGQAVVAHRLVLRVVRDTLVQQGRLAAVCRAAAAVLDTRAGALAGSLDRAGRPGRPRAGDGACGRPRPGWPMTSGELEAVLLRLRLWALYT